MEEYLLQPGVRRKVLEHVDDVSASLLARSSKSLLRQHLIEARSLTCTFSTVAHSELIENTSLPHKHETAAQSLCTPQLRQFMQYSLGFSHTRDCSIVATLAYWCYCEALAFALELSGKYNTNAALTAAQTATRFNSVASLDTSLAYLLINRGPVYTQAVSTQLLAPAAMFGHVAVLEHLVHYGASIAAHEADEAQAPLYVLALKEGAMEAFDWCFMRKTRLGCGCAPAIATSIVYHVGVTAVEQVINKLIADGIAKDECAVHAAALHGSAHLVHWLVTHKHFPLPDAEAALAAADAGHVEVLQTLQLLGVPLHNEEGNACDVALRAGQKECASWLMSIGLAPSE